MTTPNVKKQLSAMSYAIADAGVTSTAHILPAGMFAPADGRELPVEQFKLNAEVATQVIARMYARKNDTLIDYEHQNLHSKTNGQPVIAAGWFHEMAFNEDGLWALNISWTETAKRRIKEKEYRYISAVFSYDTTTGEIFDVLSIALTNTPALDGLQSLAAFTKQFNEAQTGDLTMSEKDLAALTTANAQVAALTAELGTAKASIAALTTSNAALTADLKTANDAIATAQEEKAQAALALEKKAHTDLLQTALNDGRIAPAQKAWAEKQSLAALTEYLEASKPIVNQERQSDLAKTDTDHGLNHAQLAICKAQGVKPEVFAQIRAEELDLKKKHQA